MLSRALVSASRKFSTSAIRRSEGIPPPGSNLPFQIENRYRLTLMMGLFLSTGFGIPFLMVRHQILKSQG